MTAPKFEIVHKHINNPEASAPLIIPIAVFSNTSEEQIEANIRANAAREDLRWVSEQKAHDRPAIMVGGGPSAAEFLEEIREHQAQGGAVFAMNAASGWLQRHGIEPMAQVICCAKPEAATLVDQDAGSHFFASQVNPATMEAVESPHLWHLGAENIEAFFPPKRVTRGGYVLLGGRAAVGNSALCLAYALGYRTFHLYGYDSCHRNGESHAYRQAMNDWIPTVDVDWAGKTYTTSVAMKAQAESFQINAQQLKQLGCTIHVYGDGLLQHMYTTPPENLTERDKYRMLWRTDSYRAVSPGELMADAFLAVVRPDSLVIDFGCGTGRAALKMHAAGVPVLLIDFADNCRDHEALELPFIEWDLKHPCPARARYGYCADVMEHIPPENVRRVLTNLFQAAENIFFQIDTAPDVCGAVVGAPLHLSVRPHAEWRALLSEFGTIRAEEGIEGKSVFYVERL